MWEGARLRISVEGGVYRVSFPVFGCFSMLPACDRPARSGAVQFKQVEMERQTEFPELGFGSRE